MDQSKLERLLRLMKLLTANTTYDIDQLAERLQMSRRTVYRYIEMCIRDSTRKTHGPPTERQRVRAEMERNPILP